MWLEDILLPNLIKVDWEDLPTSRVPYKKPKYSAPYKNPSPWPQNNVESIRKYTPYSEIDYNTASEKLPPWTVEKGYIKACTDVGMRRLIRGYLERTTSTYTIQQCILDLLKDNAKLKQKPEVGTTKIDTTDLKDSQKKLFNTLTLLATRNFRIYKDNVSLYPKEVTDYAEMLEWAWEDFSKLEETSFSMGQLFSTIKEILAEILVVNSSLVEEINFNSDSSHINDVDCEVLSVVVQSLKFFKDNWFLLGYDTYEDVQHDFRQIKDKIAANLQ